MGSAGPVPRRSRCVALVDQQSHPAVRNRGEGLVKPALVFDCDGVLADTEHQGHLPAFNQMFAEYGLPVQWTEEEYGRKLAIGGGKERLASLLTPQLGATAPLPAAQEKKKRLVVDWHRRKTVIYTEMVTAGALPGRPGVRRLAAEASAAG